MPSCLSRNNLAAVFLLLATLAIFTCGNRAMRPDLMEVRNLVTAREMVYDHHVMVPTMNGELRLEKPPLPTWIAAAVESLLPDNLGAQRGVAALMAMLWAGWLYLFALKVTKRRQTALTALLVFVCCYPVILHARTATWDIFCHAFMMGSIYHLYLALYQRRAVWRNFIAAGLLFGLSFMSKGPVSVYALFLPCLIGMMCYRRPHMRGKWGALCAGLCVALCVSLWWYGYLLVFEGESVRQVVQKESGAWVNHNIRPWHYYWRFFLETGIWAVLMLTTLVMWLRRFRIYNTHVASQWSFFIIWLLATLVLLSLLPEKKMRYLLPLMAPCALSMAFGLDSLAAPGKLNALLFDVNKWTIGIVALLLPPVVYYFAVRSGQMSIALFGAYAVGCLIIALLLFRLRHTEGTHFITRPVFALVLLTSVVVMPYVGSFFGNPHTRSIATLLRSDKQLGSLPFIYVNNGDHVFRIDMVYLTRHKIKVMDAAQVFNADTTDFSTSLTLPCALLIDSATADITQRVATAQDVGLKDYGLFDDNINSRNKSHYKQGLRNRLIVLKPKTHK